jgi:hypothetical protein
MTQRPPNLFLADQKRKQTAMVRTTYETRAGFVQLSPHGLLTCRGSGKNTDAILTCYRRDADKGFLRLTNGLDPIRVGAHRIASRCPRTTPSGVIVVP